MTNAKDVRYVVKNNKWQAILFRNSTKQCTIQHNLAKRVS